MRGASGAETGPALWRRRARRAFSGERIVAASTALLPREVAVLHLAALGFSPYGIGELLRIPPLAAEELLRRCLWRLGAADLRAAIGLARRRGLME